MALTSGSLFHSSSTATANNVNGAGFNPNNANFLTDLTTDTGTANTSSPIVSSASYSFVAGDVGAALYVKSGTNWLAGFYPIVSVSGGKATLNAAIGAGWTLQSGVYAPSLVVGVATVGTPTNGTWGVNYAMLDTAPINGIADFAAVGASTTLTSATAGFTRVMVGNLYHQTTNGTGGFGTVGWFEIVNYTNATTVTLDRAPNSGTASAACTGYVGGAANTSTTSGFNAMLPASAMVWLKKGVYTLTSAFSGGTSGSSGSTLIRWIGYNTVPGDACNGDDRPLIVAAANAVTLSQYHVFYNISFNTTGASGVQGQPFNNMNNCKFLNTSSTGGRFGFWQSFGDRIDVINCEAISQNGEAIRSGTGHPILGTYIHDSATGVGIANAISFNIIGCLFVGNSTGINATSTNTGRNLILNNTMYGREAKVTGGAISGNSNGTNTILGNNIYGFTTGLNMGGLSQGNVTMNNNIYNCTNATSNLNLSATDTQLDPQFVGVTEITGTVATTSGSVLTDGGADFSSVTDNVDFLHVVSGTGVTVGCYLITSHTTTTLTVNNALGTSSAGDVVYWIITGTNFQIGTNLKGLGWPSFQYSGSDTVSYPDTGAVQRQEAGGGGAGYRIKQRISGA